MTSRDAAKLGGLARAEKLDPSRRRQIARRAAKARWKGSRSGILAISTIRKCVKEAIGDRKVRVYLFGSYARGEATPRSDVDLMVIEKVPPEDFLGETHAIRRAMPIDKNVDLIVTDEASFASWKNEMGSVQYDVAKEGIRLV